MKAPIAASLVALTLGALWSGSALADHEPASRVAEADRLASSGAWSEAIGAYEHLRAEGHDEPVIEHNLGNAYFRTGALGRAVLAYRRGLIMRPTPHVRDALQANLRTTQRVLEERYRAQGDGSQFIFAQPGGLLYRITHALTPTFLTWSVVVIWWLLMGLLIARRAPSPRRWPSLVVVPVAAIVVLLSATLWGQVATDAGQRFGVVIEDEVLLREGPHRDARGVDLPEGMEVRIVTGDERWARVELANGRQGWIEASAVETL